MIKKRRIQIIIVICLLIFVYVMNHIAFFKDNEGNITSIRDSTKKVMKMTV